MFITHVCQYETVFSKLHLGHLKKMFWFSDNGFQKKGKVVRVFIFCFYFHSNMGRVFIFCFYFQRFKNITQTSSILLFWQTNNTIVFTVNRQDSRLAYPYDFGVRLTIFGAIKRPYDCCQFPYDSANLQYFRFVISLRFRILQIISAIPVIKKRCQNVKILIIIPKSI